MAGDLIVEHLDGETLVYDTERNEAHALSGVGAAEFLAADDDVSRREVIRKLALAGAAAAGAAPLIKTIVAPTPAQAQGCSPPGTCPSCCPGFGCFSNQFCIACAGATCLFGEANCCPTPGGATTACCGSGAPGSPGVCCTAAQTCVNGQCV